VLQPVKRVLEREKLPEVVDMVRVQVEFERRGNAMRTARHILTIGIFKTTPSNIIAFSLVSHNSTFREVMSFLSTEAESLSSNAVAAVRLSDSTGKQTFES
jgi:Ser-tRNA(Ala) deacylase AlaX